MNRYLNEDEWIPVDGVNYDKHSVEYEIIKGNNNHLVTAGPGAGKTELLAQKASYLLQVGKCSSPRKILSLSLKTDASDNIKDRVTKRCGEELSSRFISKTYDSFFKGLLDQFIYLLPDGYKLDINYNILENKRIDKYTYEIDKYFEKVVNGWKWLSWEQKTFYRTKYLVENSLPIIESEYGDIARNVWPLMLSGNKGIDAKISFPMIVRLVQLLINDNPMIKQILELTYEHIFLDEFQDTTEVQYDAIRDIFRDSNSIITAVGDNKQRIMKWAGAKENIFEIFKSDFNAQEKILLINHRSAPNLLRLQSVVAESIIIKEIKFKSDEKWEADSGDIKLYIFDDEEQEANLISSEVKRLKESGIKLRDICILVRQKPSEYCNKIIECLEKIGVCARYEDLYQNLVREKIVKLIIDIIKISINKQSPNEYVNVINILKKKGNKTYIDDLHRILEEVRNKLHDILSENELYLTIECIVKYIGEDFIKSYYPEYNRGNYFDIKIKEFVSLFYESYKNKNDWELAINDFIGENSIPIMSIHKSKGLEFNTVFFIGIDEKIFWSYKNNKDEELCSFFVGISRAKENLYITSTKMRHAFNCGSNIVMDFKSMINKAGVKEIKS